MDGNVVLVGDRGETNTRESVRMVWILSSLRYSF